MAFRQEFSDHNEKVIFGSELLDQTDRYEDWLENVSRNTNLEIVSPNWVLTDTFFALDQTGEIVGIIDLRHALNDFLADLGNCGYSVRPTRRKNGYAGEMLRLVIEQAQALGLAELHISVERNNLPSVKVIKKNGGVFERSFDHQGESADIYRITVK